MPAKLLLRGQPFKAYDCLIAATQTLPEFYAVKLHQPMPDLLWRGGHFAVFRPEDFTADVAGGGGPRGV